MFTVSGYRGMQNVRAHRLSQQQDLRLRCHGCGSLSGQSVPLTRRDAVSHKFRTQALTCARSKDGLVAAFVSWHSQAIHCSCAISRCLSALHTPSAARDRSRCKGEVIMLSVFEPEEYIPLRYAVPCSVDTWQRQSGYCLICV